MPRHQLPQKLALIGAVWAAACTPKPPAAAASGVPGWSLVWSVHELHSKEI